jgi:cytochrome c biogenesis protein CcmG, thiol:disulfide interchange protein DsbE
MRRALWIACALALIAVVAIGLSQAGGDEEPGGAATTQRFDLDSARARLEGAPAPLAALHAQSNELLDGGRKAFEARRDELEGTPMVINKWASWCGPCRAEFPYFQAVATARGKETAFLGVNSGDKRPAAEKFLREFPLPYPSYEDPDEDIARAIEAPANYPMTVFVDSKGKTFVKPGGYASEAALAADIDRYLGA